MICIDFQGGAHGNYLEFMCNKFLAKIKTNKLPFNQAGASHHKYKVPNNNLVFKAGHYFEYLGKKTELINSRIISIQITSHDLLPLSSVSLLRAGDYGIDNDQLEINTYKKFNNVHYKWVLDKLINGFFNNQIQNSYNGVKDNTWPHIQTLGEFKKLPIHIQDECINVHNLRLHELSDESPNCPRYILREFFKLSFKYPSESGFIKQQEKMTYDSSNNVTIFPYSSFYNTEQFVQEFTKISDWLGYNFVVDTEFLEIHSEFLSRQPYKDSKKYCDQILSKIFRNELFEFSELDLLQESYLTAHLELHYNTELPNNNMWFSNSCQIFDFVNAQ